MEPGWISRTRAVEPRSISLSAFRLLHPRLREDAARAEARGAEEVQVVVAPRLQSTPQPSRFFAGRKLRVAIRVSGRRKTPRLAEVFRRVGWENVSLGVFPSSDEEGWPRHQKNIATASFDGADGVVSTRRNCFFANTICALHNPFGCFGQLWP